MFLRPVQCDAYIFFGIYTHIGELSRVLGRNHMDMDAFKTYLANKDITLFKIGDNERAKEFVIGKQIDYYKNFIATEILFNPDDSIQCLRHLNGEMPKIKLPKEKELEINRNLLQLGFFANARYYFFHSYSTHLIK